MKKFLVCFFVLSFGFVLQPKAQEVVDSVPMFSFDVNADIVSRYIWRGQNLGGSSPAIQPAFNFNAGNLRLGAWASSSFSQLRTMEFDLSLSYTLFDLFEIMVTDYYIGTETWIDPETGVESYNNYQNYFEYRKDYTPHIFEGSLKYLGSDNSPVQFLAAVNFWGADKKKADGTLQYSTYLELTYLGKLGDQEFDFFIGVTPTDPKYDIDPVYGRGDEEGYYGHNMGVCNIGLKAYRDIKITSDYSLPVNASVIVNPMTENVFLVFGVSF